jgi:hypothetical protein
MSPVTNLGLPMAATRMSARRVWKLRSRVPEWHTVTVAPAAVRSIAIGLPTMLERPITTASAPRRGVSMLLSISITPLGVHG